MSGRYQIHTGLQHDIIQNGQDNAVDPEGRMELLPEAMRRAGLGTHMVGKWHAGFARESYCPWRRGFDTFVGYLSGCEDYYHKTAGGALDWWNGSQPAFFAPPEECPYWPGAPLAPNASARPECLGNYSADVYVREAQRHIAAHAEGGARASERMFLYLAMQVREGRERERRGERRHVGELALREACHCRVKKEQSLPAPRGPPGRARAWLLRAAPRGPTRYSPGPAAPRAWPSAARTREALTTLSLPYCMLPHHYAHYALQYRGHCRCHTARRWIAAPSAMRIRLMKLIDDGR